MAWPASWADGEVITTAKINGWNAAIQAWGGNVDTGGYAILVANGAPTDGNIPNKGIVIWIDESTNQLKFRLRYAAGTLKSGAISLT